MVKKLFFFLILGNIYLNSTNAQTPGNYNIDDDIQLIHLRDSIYVHVTWDRMENFGRFSSNGMIIIKNGQAIMIDTPMDNDKTEKIVTFLKDSWNVDLVKLIIGHFHDDCLGGLGYIQSKGIESIANSKTIDLCKKKKLLIPSTSFDDSFMIDFNGEKLICSYFGAGHSPDNITVWIPSKKILFGGCLVKSSNSRDLGNLSDAVVKDWDSTIKKIIINYHEIQTVVPGHGDIGGSELLVHTIKLVGNVKRQ
ncbi:MAG: subclass B1 metallo-beta-lactamase [Bacteroidetes bacterium HGW-Bacteroidetes-17]|jgi:metallo-beta-lactamase class B|nr:MAG: subclass B1 metallo-beta-lactamase [Bacteroidetes bacterium HGW-Bacteroidetes-17]